MMPITANAPSHGATRPRPRAGRGSRSGEAVRAHLEQHTGQQHRADGRRLGVGVGQPGVQRPHRRLDREAEADREERDDLHRARHARAVRPARATMSRVPVCAPDQQQAEQQQRRAEQRVEDELDRAPPARPSPPQMAITKYIGTSTTSKNTKNSSRSSARNVPIMPTSSTSSVNTSARGGRPASAGRERRAPAQVDEAQEGQQRGQHDQRERDPVHAEMEPQVEPGDPGQVDRELHPAGVPVVEGRGHGHRAGEHQPGDPGAPSPMPAARGTPGWRARPLRRAAGRAGG